MISRKKLLAVLSDSYALLVLSVAVSDLCSVRLRIGKVWEEWDKDAEHLTGPLVIWNRELFTQQTHHHWLLFSLEAFGVFIKVLAQGTSEYSFLPPFQGHIAGGGGSIWWEVQPSPCKVIFLSP